MAAAHPSLRIEAVPCLKDNYAYLLHAEGHAFGYLVDPSEPGPPRAALAKHGLKLGGIICTHHHWDHVGGIEQLVAEVDEVDEIFVAGSAHDRGRIPRQTHFVDAPVGRYIDSGLELAGHRLHASLVPGHTLGALAWALLDDTEQPRDIFTGDTLFAGGCGRLFEGSPAQMHESLRMICSAPKTARLWFGHEYTAANLRFAAAIEPEHAAIATRARELGTCTTPTLVADEWATNPFLRAGDAEELAVRREAKDQFKG